MPRARAMREKAAFRFGVDADNVLADSARMGVDLLNRRGGFEADPIRREELTVRPFHLSPGLVRRGVTQEQVSAALDDAWRYESRGIALMDLRLPNLISALRMDGVRIEIITTMGARDESIRPNLVAWLDQHYIRYDTLHFVSGSAEKLAFPVHTIVDDEHKLAVELAEGGRHGLVYKAPWNVEFVQGHARNPGASRLIIPVANWTETAVEVRSLASNLRS